MSRVSQACDARNGSATIKTYRPTVKIPWHMQGALEDAAKRWGRTPSKTLAALLLVELDRQAMKA